MICPFMYNDVIDMQIPCCIHVFIVNVLAVVLKVAIENKELRYMDMGVYVTCYCTWYFMFTHVHEYMACKIARAIDPHHYAEDRP